MSLVNRLIHSASTTRLTVSGNKETYAALLTNEPCIVQPMSEQAAITVGIEASKAHRGYFQLTADIEANDVATVNGIGYKVHGVKIHNYGGSPHKRVLLEQTV